MANISSAFGTFKLFGVWNEEMIKNINILREEWDSWYYGIHFHEEFDVWMCEYNFHGSGRWSYSPNLEMLGVWTKSDNKSDVIKAYTELCVEMELRASYIEIDYADEEGGSGILYKATAEITAKDGDFIYKETSYEPYEYTPENLVEVGFYDSMEDYHDSNCDGECVYCGYESCSKRLESDKTDDMIKDTMPYFSNSSTDADSAFESATSEELMSLFS